MRIATFSLRAAENLRTLTYPVAWIAIVVMLSWLLYPLILAGGGPFTDCLSDPYAWTPGASSLNCRTDPFGIRQMFDTAYRAGYLSRQTSSVISAGLLGMFLGTFLFGGAIVVISRVSGKERRISEDWVHRDDMQLEKEQVAEQRERRRELRRKWREEEDEKKESLTDAELTWRDEALRRARLITHGICPDCAGKAIVSGGGFNRMQFDCENCGVDYDWFPDLKCPECRAIIAPEAVKEEKVRVVGGRLLCADCADRLSIG